MAYLSKIAKSAREKKVFCANKLSDFVGIA